MIGVIAVCDVERLTDLEITKKEVLIEKEKMKYGALTGRRKDLGTKKYTPLSRSSLSDRDDQVGVDSRYEENKSSDMKILIDENKIAVGETSGDHSNESNGKLDDMNSSKLINAVAVSIPAAAKVVVNVIPEHPRQSTTSASSLSHTRTQTPASSSSPSSSSSSSSPPSTSLSSSSAVSARESLARSVSSMLYSLSLLGVTFRNLPPEGMESIWRGLRSFSKGTYCHSCYDM